MILTALNDYYQRLLANPDSNSGLAKVPPYGFTDEKIGYVLVLSKAGMLIDVIPNLYQRDKKEAPKLETLPWSFDRTGKFTEKAFTSG
jgi:CRISPR-associated protein Csd1